MEQKRRKIEKGKVENWKWKEEKLKNEERHFFFFSLFKTTEIFLVSTKMGIFYRGKKSGEMTLAPQKKYSSYAPANCDAMKQSESEVLHNDIFIFLYRVILTAHNWQKWKKEYSSHAPAIKFIGMKQLV